MLILFLRNVFSVRKYPAAFLLLFLYSSSGFGQSLPHQMDAAEKSAMPAYLLQVQNQYTSGITQPPVLPVRASAEWEEIDGLIITWTSYTTILRDIVRYAQTETQVLIVCSDSTTVKNYLSSNSVPLTNISYIIAPFNSIWCRDYGPWNVYTNDVDSLALIDWIYNRPRPKDDTVPSAIERFTGLPMYQTTTFPYDLIHTGGNFMCDGMGTGFSSRLITDENPSKTEAEIDTIMKQFMGIDRYIKMNTLPYDQIHHIDMHIKLLDEETLLVGEYPPGVADGPAIEANLQYVLNNFMSPFGTPYKVIRIPMPPDAFGNYPNNGGDYRTYANAVFVNKTVILPFYQEQYDTVAQRIWQEALPGYRIVGIDCNSIIPSLGAIHCITKEVASADPLWIVHQPLHDTYSTSTPYTVEARLTHRSGIVSANVYFRTDTLLPYQSVPMNQLSPPASTWSADIPPQPAGSTVYYYIEAEANSGKTQVRPLPAPAGYWKFNVLLNTGFASHTLPSGFHAGEPFPNPATHVTSVPVYTEKNTSLSITLQSIPGNYLREIFQGNVSGERSFEIRTDDLPEGLYIVRYRTPENCVEKKLVILHGRY